MRRCLPIAVAFSCLCLQASASAQTQWDGPQPAAAQQQPVEQPPAAQPVQAPAPTMQQLVQASLVPFDPQRESPEAFMSRMKIIEQSMKELTDRQTQARLDPPIHRLPEGVVLPGMSAYQSENNFSANPYDRGFFNGITPQQASAALKMQLPQKVRPNLSPEWAKQKPPAHEFVDGVEHFGKQDSMGFF
ncbi:MAG TPA: hypothetical protein V6D22_00050 [Candidatus Obscuribacterales bacterium]